MMRTVSQVKAVKQETPLREKRHQSGLTQREVAAEIGVSFQSFALLEAGKHVPILSTAYKIAKFFECSVYDIFPVDQVLGSDE